MFLKMKTRSNNKYEFYNEFYNDNNEHDNEIFSLKELGFYIIRAQKILNYYWNIY